MRKPDTWTSTLLLDLGAQEAFVGDLLEEYASGRSRLWYWQQVLTAIWLLSVRSVGARRTRTLLSVVGGWATLLIAFAVAGDRSAEALAGSGIGTDRRPTPPESGGPFRSWRFLYRTRDLRFRR
jgi:hypothetical protein